MEVRGRTYGSVDRRKTSDVYVEVRHVAGEVRASLHEQHRTGTSVGSAEKGSTPGELAWREWSQTSTVDVGSTKIGAQTKRGQRGFHSIAHLEGGTEEPMDP
jgi:hypothetical protein